MTNRLKDRWYTAFSSMLLRRFLLTLLIYSVAFFALFAILFFIASMILSRQIWYGNDALYILLRGIKNNSVLCAFVCWLLGFSLILYLYWRKLLGFIAAIVHGSNQLVGQDESLIVLPAELKQIEDRMNEAKHAALRNRRLAKEEERRKNDLIVYLAHDLKTPLTSVIGYLTLLRDETQISAELREKYLSVALGKADRLEDLINEFFEITRFNLHEIILETGPVNVSVMLRQMADEMLPVMDEKTLSVSLDIPDGLMIEGDGGKLARVFDNLFKNAVTYSSENTVIHLSAVDCGEAVTMRIRNMGETIPEQKLNRIFEQFFRLDPSRATQGGSAGLGLAIARQIVNLHGGTITAASAEHITEFTVVLPKNKSKNKS